MVKSLTRKPGDGHTHGSVCRLVLAAADTLGDERCKGPLVAGTY